MAKYHQVMLSMLVRMDDDAEPETAADDLAKAVASRYDEMLSFVRAEAVSSEPMDPEVDPGEAMDDGEDDDGDDVAVDESGVTEMPEGATVMSDAQAQQLMLQAMATDIAGTLHRLSQLPPMFIGQLAEATAREQLQIMEQIIPTIVDPGAAAAAPTLILNVFDPKNKEVAVTMKAPKRLDDVRELAVAAQAGTLLAFIMCPQARAVLKAYGFSYAFAQSKEAPPGKIVLAH